MYEEEREAKLKRCKMSTKDLSDPEVYLNILFKNMVYHELFLSSYNTPIF